MNNLRELRSMADSAAIWRGHSMGWAPPYYSETQSIQSATCEHCGMSMQVIVNPLPNQIDIGGEAVALNCKQGQCDHSKFRRVYRKDLKRTVCQGCQK